jgi:hypothetical protein
MHIALGILRSENLRSDVWPQKTTAQEVLRAAAGPEEQEFWLHGPVAEFFAFSKT